MLCAQDAAIGRIVDLVTEAQVVVCPYDGTVFEKDGACTHIDSCPVRSSPNLTHRHERLVDMLWRVPSQSRLPNGQKHGRICYYCGKKWSDVDPPNSSDHKKDWQTNPKRCAPLRTSNSF